HTLTDLVGAIVFSNFFAHEEYAGISAHFFAHGFTQGFAELDYTHSILITKRKNTLGKGWFTTTQLLFLKRYKKQALALLPGLG
ncbi:hypothetical protein P0P54_09455, partial [Campylobacter jejuni]|uniref:hypothetical protein n=1 Tax=Campylobacter jejuni TaxID=197 RepID=UPI002FBE81CE